MESRKLILFMIGAFLLVMSINLVSAEFWACFEDGDEIDFCNPNIDDRECEGDLCKYCMKKYNDENECFTPGSYNKCNKVNGCNSFGEGGIDSEPPEMTINSPINDSLHTKRKVLFDVLLNEESDLYYMDLLSSRERWKKLCNNCNLYNKSKSFKEGLNSIRLRSTDENDNEGFQDINFFIDSKDPRIRSTDPTRGFASGTFNVEFDEDNPESLFLNYGNDLTGWRFDELDINECSIDRNYECNTYVDLSDYDGQEISYWFNLTDIVGNFDESKDRDLDVDISFPVINDISYEVDGSRVEFVLNITELNLDEIEYIDNNSSRPRWKRMCSRLKDGLCEKRISLREEGEHDIGFQIIDEAGNMISTKVIVNIEDD